MFGVDGSLRDLLWYVRTDKEHGSDPRRISCRCSASRSYQTEGIGTHQTAQWRRKCVAALGVRHAMRATNGTSWRWFSLMVTCVSSWSVQPQFVHSSCKNFTDETASRRTIHILPVLQTVQVAYRLFLPRSCRSACAFSLSAICRRDFVAFGQWSDQRAGATHSGKAHGDFQTVGVLGRARRNARLRCGYYVLPRVLSDAGALSLPSSALRRCLWLNHRP